MKPTGHNVGMRVCAVIAAFSLVIAFALASLFPPALTLGQLIAKADHDVLVAFQNFVRTRVSEWMWDAVAIPVLLRPAWLMPTALGLVSAGAAVTLGTMHGAPRSRRRRS